MWHFCRHTRRVSHLLASRLHAYLIYVVLAGKERPSTPEHLSKDATNGPNVHRFAVIAFRSEHHLRCSIPPRYNI